MRCHYCGRKLKSSKVYVAHSWDSLSEEIYLCKGHLQRYWDAYLWTLCEDEEWGKGTLVYHPFDAEVK